jgi:hypothetical protein
VFETGTYVKFEGNIWPCKHILTCAGNNSSIMTRNDDKWHITIEIDSQTEYCRNGSIFNSFGSNIFYLW